MLDATGAEVEIDQIIAMPGAYQRIRLGIVTGFTPKKLRVTILSESEGLNREKWFTNVKSYRSETLVESWRILVLEDARSRWNIIDEESTDNA